MHSVKTDGTGLRTLVELDLPGLVAWSPDQSRIAVYVLPGARGESKVYPDENTVLYTVAKDGSDRRVLVRSGGGRLVAENSGWRDVSGDIAACSEGFVVSNPKKNAGLVGDCEILLSIRDTLAGENVVLGWGADTPIDEWPRVHVGGDPPRVQGLTAGYQHYHVQLTGSIPPEIGALTGLERLWLGRHLTGPIPPELGNLSELRDLSLHENGLTGEIPSELGRLSNLESLSLSGNDLSGSIPPELAIWTILLDCPCGETDG